MKKLQLKNFVRHIFENEYAYIPNIKIQFKDISLKELTNRRSFSDSSYDQFGYVNEIFSHYYIIHKDGSYEYVEDSYIHYHHASNYSNSHDSRDIKVGDYLKSKDAIAIAQYSYDTYVQKQEVIVYEL